MFLIAAMEPFLKDKAKALFAFHVLVFNQIDVTDSQLDDLENTVKHILSYIICILTYIICILTTTLLHGHWETLLLSMLEI
jgi:hypothetical protein